jgi:nucleotide-binding universal stress UspA family protein
MIMFNEVVVGADNSATARQAVASAVELVGLTGGTIHIVVAWNAHSGPSRTQRGGYVKDADPAGQLLKDLAEIAEGQGLEPVLHQSKSAPEDALVEVAKEVDADLIVVGNKGMKGAARVLGSVPNSVAHRAPCSVLIVDTAEAG